MKQARKTREGVVVSNKMQKTVTVSVSRTIHHARYKKVVQVSKRFYAHCELPEIEVGQKVRIKETRPLSKLKRWEVVEVLG